MNTTRVFLISGMVALLAWSGTGCDWLFEESDATEWSADANTLQDTQGIPPGSDIQGTQDTPFTPPEGVTLPEVQVPQTTSLPELVAAYQQAATQVQTSNKDFIDAYQAFAMADTSDVAAFMQKTQAVNAAGDQWIVAVLTLNGYAKQFAGFKGDAMGKADGPILTVPGVPVTLPFNVGKLIGTTKEKIAQIEKAHNEGRIPDDEYHKAVSELKKTQTLDAVGTGLAAGSTVAGGFVVKAGLVLAGASGGVLVGGTILGAAAIGLSVKFLWSYCSGGKSDSVDGGYCTMQTHDGKVGEVVPLQFPGKGTLIIQVEGKEPIVIEDFGVDGGQVVVVDFEPGDPNSGTPPGTPTVTPADPSQFGTCEQVSGVSATPNPIDPGPGEGVTVTATTIPPVPGCTINFSIVGTDGYTNSASPASDATGTATFYIPGGAEGVVDNVTISVGSHTTTVVYSF
ncbi:MAG: hypothetical protein FJ109_03290 [Deltaproteobacteria bacterium]|nr:hypothetical protein [Deltaproteobacteria bacterium]